jgi:hypothetical protein
VVRREQNGLTGRGMDLRQGLCQRKELRNEVGGGSCWGWKLGRHRSSCGRGGSKQCYCVCGDVGREVIRLTHSQGNLIHGQGPYLLLTPYTHGVPHVDCEGPCDVTRTNPLLPPGRKALETCPHQESNRVPIVLAVCTAGWLACCSAT